MLVRDKINFDTTVELITIFKSKWKLTGHKDLEELNKVVLDTFSLAVNTIGSRWVTNKVEPEDLHEVFIDDEFDDVVIRYLDSLSSEEVSEIFDKILALAEYNNSTAEAIVYRHDTHHSKTNYMEAMKFDPSNELAFKNALLETVRGYTIATVIESGLIGELTILAEKVSKLGIVSKCIIIDLSYVDVYIN